MIAFYPRDFFEKQVYDFLRLSSGARDQRASGRRFLFCLFPRVCGCGVQNPWHISRYPQTKKTGDV
jgi:hypothetical protein